MQGEKFSEDIQGRIKKLESKYAAMGQDLVSYLDGLLYADYNTYWNYVYTDTLLSLQNPKTNFPDEVIFIIYHQITELYFKLCLHEMDQISDAKELNADIMSQKINRMNCYFDNLCSSFDIMVDGMDPDQFTKFRMSLLPASGFQSCQYRQIEIGATDFIQLVHKEERNRFSVPVKVSEINQLYPYLYWKRGATELATGKKTLTLRQFEKKYGDDLIRLAKKMVNRNLWAKYKSLPASERKQPALKQALRRFDVNVNINWPLVHFKSAVRYLQRAPKDIAATGGTNWQKYLPPRFQKRIFYPSLWTAEEKREWGKSWVKEVVLKGEKTAV